MEDCLHAPESFVAAFCTTGCVFEMAILILGFAISAVFLIVFIQIRSLHPNLILIFTSLSFASLLAITIRMYYLMRVLTHTHEGDWWPSMETLVQLRTITLYVAGLHLLLLACERLLASKRSKTYEKERYASVLALLFVIMWAYSVAIVFVPHNNSISQLVVAASYILSFVPSILVRENIETALSLCRCFTVLAVQAFIGWAALMAYFILSSMKLVWIYENLCAFVFEISTGLSPVTIPLVLYLYNVKVNTAFKRQFSTVFRHRIESSSTGKLVGLDGRQLNVTVEEEGKLYFKQLQDAWR